MALYTVSYAESDLEQAALEWFEELNYDKAYGPDISPEGEYPERQYYQDVILEDRLREALIRINKQVPREAIEEAVRIITIPRSPSLLINNKAFQKMITDGIDVQYRNADGDYPTVKVWIFDTHPDRIHNNDFLVVNQFTVIENQTEKRPDIVVFINGLPLAVIELKSASNEEVGISDAFNQVQTYKHAIPSLFTYNSVMVISDGVNARVGTLTADEDRFMMWRTIDGEDVAAASIPQLEVLIKGMFKKHRLLDIIKHFVLFQTDGEHIYKIVAGYHQYHATNKAIESTERATLQEGDRKIGVIWHTQGSGKSLSMVFYAGKLVLALDNPTIVVVTDRNDLDDQLFATFSKSKDLLRQTPQQAKDRVHLRDLLSVESGGIIFTTVHKFAPEEDEAAYPVLTDRRNVIVIADEAHRSQYGFHAEMAGKNDEAAIKYGYAKYMRDALPNASYIGYTGTPIELADKNTPAVFGDYIDVYDMTRAVEDGTTVKIYYESRIARLELSDEERPRIDDDYEEITEYQEFSQQQKLKSKWARLEALAGAEKRVKKIAKDIVTHYEQRQGAMAGKAMIAVMSRRIAIDLYKAIIALRPEWHSDDDNEGKIKIVMTGSSSDPEDWQPYIGNKRRREHLAKRMKDLNDPLQIVIVRDMWLTGFDVPSMSTMYIDKPMKGHNLMQAIARVNRVFGNKPGGLIVDYIGIADSLKSALQQYTENDRKTAGIDTDQAVDYMVERIQLIRELLYGHNYTKFASEKASERMQAIVETVDHVLGLGKEGKRNFLNWTVELAHSYALCATTEAAEQLNVEISFYKAVKSAIVKLITPENKRKTTSELDAQLNQLLSKSVISEEVVDILEAVGLQKPNIAILSNEFLEHVKGLKQKNLAVELLRRLLQGKVKAVSRTSVVQSRKFSEMLDEAIRKYNNRTIETTQVIEELIQMAKEMNAAVKRGEDLGLIKEELAFYDALASNESAKQMMGDIVLKQIAHELTQAIKSNIKVDWTLRENVRAQMRVIVKRLLKKYGYPPDLEQMAIDLVIEQAEVMGKSELEEFHY
ncbi:type I restriction endonuclease subunit R [Paenibacillus thiaminolyticus]|uniref:Type I restriction enzyme endonuclease subunit n=1 Tax=Paenibacillus thiaminolyticus TaxID=49283 RepID=A0AAP9DUT2_PANTH|nr:type I restriction endonuclease subunit R [Paenibacillus thiaminolyticus]MCY9538721.1 type I restriction endonuclease subunit R [Paenibacillus thiaminolyticus]MCY9600396.1 type I restriction endonuclease subunit R [Paenibacillus thiaminolyticus]MCY9607274.1 type I restriction endonuclease subunit R [Paenibacillus thiaminolyticus]MCY9614465.1 type I restriction endonuclease subunit R [Paenibacillus thiaminolyticus]MCY9621505.1 type I restriction endonuclease subunit R [Paenibacillus thiamino